MQGMEIEENPQTIERSSKRILRRTKTGVKHGRGVIVGCNSVHNLPKHQNNTRYLWGVVLPNTRGTVFLLLALFRN